VALPPDHRYRRIRRCRNHLATGSVDIQSAGSFVWEDGREQTFRIVVEDEADPLHGTVSYVSPLARAVLTYGPGDTVEIAGGKAVILDFR
jgi:transcription elongation GreA/GreB family factor